MPALPKLVLAASLAFIAAAGLAPAPAPAADDVLLPFSPPKFSAPTTIRIGSARFLVSATIIRSFPGNVPDPEIDPAPQPSDSLLVRVEQVGSRNGPVIFSAAAIVATQGGTPATLPLTRGSDGRVIQFSSSPFPSGTIPPLAVASSLPIRAAITLNTNRGRRAISIANIPITVIAYPETTR